MGQEEILNVLSKSRVPLSAEEIAKEINSTTIKVCMDISQLLKFHEIECIELTRQLAYKFFNCKRKMRLYYI